MSRVAWTRLMQLGLVRLRLSPEAFWSLTPAELMLMAGGGVGRETLTRAGLIELAAQFPDTGSSAASDRE